jgi:hypothetical protein
LTVASGASMIRSVEKVEIAALEKDFFCTAGYIVPIILVLFARGNFVIRTV